MNSVVAVVGREAPSNGAAAVDVDSVHCVVRRDAVQNLIQPGEILRLILRIARRMRMIRRDGNRTKWSFDIANQSAAIINSHL